MKILNKILIIPILLGCIIFNFALADDSDCGIFAIGYYHKDGSDKDGFDIVKNSRETGTNQYSSFLSGVQTKIIDSASLNTALLNLKKYCCENELGGLSKGFETCKTDSTFFNDNALDSPYLFDHLFDVIMRRLNGLTGDTNIYTKTNMEVDKKGEKWRTFISQQTENTSGANPQTIIDEYEHTRNQNSDYNMNYSLIRKIYTQFSEESNANFLQYVSGQGKSRESKEIAKALQNYENRTLLDRYNNACALSEYFYALLNTGIPSTDKIRTQNTVLQGKCDEIIKKQIGNENTYVQLVIQESANLFLSNYIQEYTKYLQKRTETLKDHRRNSVNKFQDVVRAVSELLKTCVH